MRRSRFRSIRPATIARVPGGSNIEKREAQAILDAFLSGPYGAGFKPEGQRWYLGTVFNALLSGSRFPGIPGSHSTDEGKRYRTRVRV